MIGGNFQSVDLCMDAVSNHIKFLDMEIVHVGDDGIIFQGCGVLVDENEKVFYEAHLVHLLGQCEFYGVELSVYFTK